MSAQSTTHISMVVYHVTPTTVNLVAPFNPKSYSFHHSSITLIATFIADTTTAYLF